MAVKYFCDRCGRQCSSKTLLGAVVLTEDDIDLNLGDLCESCQSQLKQFMERLPEKEI